MKRRKISLQQSSGSSAWKLAYADFVTAMMIFFLLMWLVNTSSSEEKNNLVIYFEESFTLGGASRRIFDIFPRNASEQTQDMYSPQDQKKIITALKQQGEDNDAADNAMYDPTPYLRQTILQKFDQTLDPEKSVLRQRIFFQSHKSGTMIHLIDHDRAPFFSRGRSTLTSRAKDILEILAETLKNLPGNVRIIGHTDAKQYRPRSTYTNWELSTDRAQATRRFLFQKGMTQNITWVAGQGDKYLLFPQDPFAAANRRISLLYVPSPQNQGNDARIGKEIEHK